MELLFSGLHQVLLLILIRQYATPQTLGAPDTAAQCFELHDLTVIHEQVHFGTVAFNVPGKHFRIGGNLLHLWNIENGIGEGLGFAFF